MCKAGELCKTCTSLHLEFPPEMSTDNSDNSICETVSTITPDTTRSRGARGVFPNSPLAQRDQRTRPTSYLSLEECSPLCPFAASVMAENNFQVFHLAINA